jgi:uncharacterized protein
MGLPRKLKNMNAFVDGASHLGVVAEFELPELAIKTEEWRGGGMIGPVDIDMGLEKMMAKLKMGGFTIANIRKFGTTRADGVRIRLVGAYQRDDGTPVQTVEAVISGRFTKIGMGSSKPGDDTEHEYEAPLTYFKLVVDNRTEIEVDMLDGTFIVDGIDRYAEIMAAIT